MGNFYGDCMIEALRTKFALRNGPNFYSQYSWNSPVFLFTNENIQGYLNQMNSVSGKDVLTVGASGDHAFECILAGAKNVDTFDTNFLQKHVIELKQKIIGNLSYADFMRFFFEPNTFFSYEIIKPIWKLLSPGLQEFLNYYYSNRKKGLFRYGGAQHSDYNTVVSYVQYESEYKDLARLMPDKINFIECDIQKISTKTDKKYDTILLSNIYEYVNPDVRDSCERIIRFYDEILTDLADSNLKADNGQIAFNYIWRADLINWQAVVYACEQYLKTSINSFNENIHELDVLDFGTSRTGSNLEVRPDIAMVMTQKVR